MSKINLKKLATIENGVAVAICFVVFVLNFWYIRYGTNDDMLIALSDYNFWAELAKRQGRIGHYFVGPIASLPHVFNDIHYLSASRMLSWFLLLFTAGGFMAVLLRNWFAFPLTVLVVSLLWSNSIEGHNLLVSYPVYILFRFSLFIAAITLFIASARANNKRGVLASSVLLFFVFVSGNEFYFQYIPFLLIGLYYFFNNANDKSQYMTMIRPVWVSVLASLFVVILFKIYFPSGYSGNSAVSFDVPKITITLTTLTLGLFPDVQAWLNREYLFHSPYNLGIALAVSSAAVGLLIFLQKKIRVITVDNLGAKKNTLILSALVLAIIAPNALISLTNKYQEWVAYGITNYAYSSMSYLVFALMIVSLLVVFARRKLGFIMVSIVFGILVFFTQLNNLYVGGLQRAHSVKWELFDAAIGHINEHDVDGKRATISLPENFFVGIPQEYYWQSYAAKKLGFGGRVTQGGNGNVQFHYFPSVSNGAILMVESGGLITDIFTSFACKKLAPCHLNIIGRLSGNLIKTGREDRSVSLDSGYRHGRVYAYKLINPIHRDAISGLSFHDFEHLRNEAVTISFGEGIYDLESLESTYWRWARFPSTFYVNSDAQQNVSITLTVTPVADMVIKVRLKNNEYTFPMKGGARQDINFDVELHVGKNEFSLDSDVKPIRLNQRDPRVFSFVISSVQIIAK